MNPAGTLADHPINPDSPSTDRPTPALPQFCPSFDPAPKHKPGRNSPPVIYLRFTSLAQFRHLLLRPPLFENSHLN
jgi:hypothetical protein